MKNSLEKRAAPHLGPQGKRSGWLSDPNVLRTQRGESPDVADIPKSVFPGHVEIGDPQASTFHPKCPRLGEEMPQVLQDTVTDTARGGKGRIKIALE